MGTLRCSKTPKLSQTLKGSLGGPLTGHAPIHEFRHVDAPFANFTLMHEDVICFELGGEFTLGKSGIFPHGAEKCGQLSIPACMLRLGHARHYRPAAACYPLDNKMSRDGLFFLTVRKREV
jgi:hypothetical protein